MKIKKLKQRHNFWDMRQFKQQIHKLKKKLVKRLKSKTLLLKKYLEDKE